MKEGIKKYIATWEQNCYFDGIPMEVEPRLTQLNKAPSYKELCSIILKNDHNLKSLGYSKKKCNSYHELKRIELSVRSGRLTQLRLKL